MNRRNGKAFTLHLYASKPEPDWKKKLETLLGDLRGCYIRDVEGSLRVKATLVVEEASGPLASKVNCGADDVAWAVGMLIKRKTTGLTLLYASTA